MKLLIDASAWIEYLEGSDKGEKVSTILKNNADEVYVLPITISEVVSKIERKNADSQLAYEVIVRNAKILEMTPRFAKVGGLFHAQIRKKISHFGIVDAVLITAARDSDAKLVTADHHFKSFKETILL